MYVSFVSAYEYTAQDSAIITERKLTTCITYLNALVYPERSFLVVLIGRADDLELHNPEISLGSDEHEQYSVCQFFCPAKNPTEMNNFTWRSCQACVRLIPFHGNLISWDYVTLY